MTSPLRDEINAALEAVVDAERKLYDAGIRLSQARNDETHCLNEYNTATKTFDVLVQKLKDRAPATSDWKSLTDRTRTAPQNWEQL